MEPDAKMPVQPRLIAGGGIGDGPIDGVVNLYVIDDDSRQPIANATVRVGTASGVTDSTGLFVAEGVTGPQTIAVKAASHRSDVWIGVNGANVTMNLEAANTPAPASATLAGSINNFQALAVAAGHTKIAVASYSQLDELGDEANNIEQPTNQNVCIGTTACNFMLTSRTGKVAVIAAIFDRDLKGTPNDPNDDTQTFLGWAVKTGLSVSSGATQNVALDVISNANSQDITVSFGSTPSGLSTVAGLVGIETPDGTIPLSPMFPTPTATMFKAPKPEAVAGATYRLTGFATDGQTNPRQSFVIRRNQTGSTISAGEWLAPPTGTPTRTGATWTSTPNATVYTVEYKQGSTNLVNLTTFDGSTSATIPDFITATMPSGSLTVQIQAIGAPGLDVQNFGIDADRDKLVMVGGSQSTL